jgi:hypothetical protein
VLITLQATDAASGVQRLDFGATGDSAVAPASVPGPVAVATVVLFPGTWNGEGWTADQGTSTLTFGATDAVGHTEPTQTLTVRLDLFGPAVTASNLTLVDVPNPDGSGGTVPAYEFSITAADALSGLGAPFEVRVAEDFSTFVTPTLVGCSMVLDPDAPTPDMTCTYRYIFLQPVPLTVDAVATDRANNRAGFFGAIFLSESGPVSFAAPQALRSAGTATPLPAGTTVPAATGTPGTAVPGATTTATPGAAGSVTPAGTGTATPPLGATATVTATASTTATVTATATGTATASATASATETASATPTASPAASATATPPPPTTPTPVVTAAASVLPSPVSPALPATLPALTTPVPPALPVTP